MFEEPEATAVAVVTVKIKTAVKAALQSYRQFTNLLERFSFDPEKRFP